ncbi:Triose-phosphate Transporter family protein [Cryptosporidium felis]|nr:Triose-phosphate Transporter family protein [Cryptosporidium felis]
MGEYSEEQPSFMKKTSALLLYGIVSISLVFLNKRIFVGSFSYPIFTTWVQQVCGMVCYIVAYFLLKLTLGEASPFSKPTFYPERIRLCLPMSGACSMYILLSNICLKYVPVSSYAVTRSLTLLFNVILSMLILKSQFSRTCLLGCGIVILGFIISSFDSSSLNLNGIIAGATSSLFQSIYTVQIKNVTLNMGDEFQVYWYNALLTSILVPIPMFFFGDYRAFSELLTLAFRDFSIVFGPIVLSGVLNFFLGIVTNWCVHITSPIAYNITGYIKSGVQTTIGIVFNHESYHSSTILGLIMTIGGSAVYTFGNLHKPESSSESSTSKGGYKKVSSVKVSDDEYTTDISGNENINCVNAPRESYHNNDAIIKQKSNDRGGVQEKKGSKKSTRPRESSEEGQNIHQSVNQIV